MSESATAGPIIDGHTRLIAHIGYPTGSFKAPMIYNPWFESIGLNALVVPMGVPTEDFDTAFSAITRFTNFHGALITMPHKVSVVEKLDDISIAVPAIAGSCNAVVRRTDGTARRRHVRWRGLPARHAAQGRGRAKGRSALVVGSGGVGSAIAAALAGGGLAAHRALRSESRLAMEGLADRLRGHYPGARGRDGLERSGRLRLCGERHAARHEGRATRCRWMWRVLRPPSFVGEVVMSQETTAFLAAARGARLPHAARHRHAL